VRATQSSLSETTGLEPDAVVVTELLELDLTMGAALGGADQVADLLTTVEASACQGNFTSCNASLLAGDPSRRNRRLQRLRRRLAESNVTVGVERVYTFSGTGSEEQPLTTTAEIAGQLVEDAVQTAFGASLIRATFEHVHVTPRYESSDEAIAIALSSSTVLHEAIASRISASAVVSVGQPVVFYPPPPPLPLSPPPVAPPSPSPLQPLVSGEMYADATEEAVKIAVPIVSVVSLLLALACLWCWRRRTARVKVSDADLVHQKGAHKAGRFSPRGPDLTWQLPDESEKIERSVKWVDQRIAERAASQAQLLNEKSQEVDSLKAENDMLRATVTKLERESEERFQRALMKLSAVRHVREAPRPPLQAGPLHEGPGGAEGVSGSIDASPRDTEANPLAHRAAPAAPNAELRRHAMAVRASLRMSSSTPMTQHYREAPPPPPMVRDGSSAEQRLANIRAAKQDRLRVRSETMRREAIGGMRDLLSQEPTSGREGSASDEAAQP